MKIEGISFGIIFAHFAEKRKDILPVRWVYEMFVSMLSRLTLVSTRLGLGPAPAKSEMDAGLWLLYLLIVVALLATVGLVIYLNSP
jgi:hypothetical protein